MGKLKILKRECKVRNNNNLCKEYKILKYHSQVNNSL